MKKIKEYFKKWQSANWVVQVITVFLMVVAIGGLFSFYQSYVG
jgi:hypothetical protein